MHAQVKPPLSISRLWLAGLVFALVFPSLLTWVYFVALADSSTATQRTAYVVGKLIQFGFPILYLALLARRRSLWRRLTVRRGLAEGLASGVVILVAVLVAWRLLAASEPGLIGDLATQVDAKLTGLGLASPWRYVLLASFYSLLHTLLEEYYWRWFVFGELRRRLALGAALGISSVAFMAHHIVVIGFYLGADSPWTWLFSIAVALGGAYWSWLYERSGSLLAPWVSHFFVDLAIFAVGWALLG